MCAAALLILMLVAAQPAVVPAQTPPASAAPIALTIRVFDGTEEVTRDTRVTVFKAGDRQSPIAPQGGVLEVAPGFYDAQVIREQNGTVTGIRWVEQLVVMRYPDEGGDHLEVVNLQSNYGAIEIRNPRGPAPDAALFAPGAHDTPVARPITDGDYVLFVVPAGAYDVRIGAGQTLSWRANVDVPADRMRFLLANPPANLTGARSDAPPAEQADHDHHQRDDEQDVNERARDVQAEPDRPQNQQQYGNRPEHATSCGSKKAIKMPRGVWA
ncbi:MAG: hypothetical protein ACRD1V_02180 [Vicinamibacterales bacterium]